MVDLKKNFGNRFQLCVAVAPAGAPAGLCLHANIRGPSNRVEAALSRHFGSARVPSTTCLARRLY